MFESISATPGSRNSRSEAQQSAPSWRWPPHLGHRSTSQHEWLKPPGRTPQSGHGAPRSVPQSSSSAPYATGGSLNPFGNSTGASMHVAPVNISCPQAVHTAPTAPAKRPPKPALGPGSAPPGRDNARRRRPARRARELPRLPRRATRPQPVGPQVGFDPLSPYACGLGNRCSIH